MKVLKGRLNCIQRSGVDYSPLMNCISRANDIMMVGSYLLRGYLLYLREQKSPIPEINRQLIGYVFNAISKKSSGPKPKNTELLISLEKFYLKQMCPKMFPQWNPKKDDIDIVKFSAVNLSYILKNCKTMMITNYETHMRLHFENKLRQFVNQSFKNDHLHMIQNCKGNVGELKKQLKIELKNVKESLLENNDNYPPQYQKWVKMIRSKILPTEFRKTISYDVQKHPLKYISVLMEMNHYLEKNELKTLQYMPLRTATQDKFVTIDTQALLDIFPFKNKEKYTGKIRDLQGEMWHTIFNLSKFKYKDHTFNHTISTDGFSVSIVFADNKDIKLKKMRLDRMLGAGKKVRKEMKNKTWEEKQAAKKARMDNKIKKVVNADKIHAAQLKKSRDAFNKLSKEEKRQITLKKRLSKDNNYISDLIQVNDEKEKLTTALQQKKLVYVDPGKRSIVTMMDENGNMFNYTTRNRLAETKRLKYQKLIQNKRRKIIDPSTKKTLETLETELGENSGKSTNSKTFVKYGLEKIRLRMMLKVTNYHKYLQKLNWFSYINRKRHDDNVLNRIENKYGSDAIFVYGDWSGKGCAKGISTPGIGFRRRLSRRFTVHLIDERNTSAVSCVSGERCENWRINFNGHYRKIHSVLTFKTSNQRLACMNRDVNAVRNMRIITQSLIQTGERPKIYKKSKLKNPNSSSLVRTVIGAKS